MQLRAEGGVRQPLQQFGSLGHEGARLLIDDVELLLGSDVGRFAGRLAAVRGEGSPCRRERLCVRDGPPGRLVFVHWPSSLFTGHLPLAAPGAPRHSTVKPTTVTRGFGSVNCSFLRRSVSPPAAPGPTGHRRSSAGVRADQYGV
jgi:hypothetical protein